MKKIAICIPTYNRAKILEDICYKIIHIVDRHIADVFVYDSSPNVFTEEKVKKIVNDNVYYHRIDDRIHSSKKVYNIYQNKDIQNNYEYLWILPDYFFVSEQVMNNILCKLDEKWDMVMLDFYDPEKSGNKPYFDPKEIFLEYAWSLTQYGILILNCHTVLKKANWRYLEEKYLNDKCCNFSHLTMYFEMMLNMENLKFYHLSVPQKEIYRSKYKQDESEYFNEYLTIWGYRWYQSIQALPDDYMNKDKVMKSACIYTKHLAKQNLAKLKKNKILTKEIFKEYYEIWPFVSTVSRKEVWILLYLPQYIINYIAEYGSVKGGVERGIFILRLKLFCRKYNKIYLYGAGLKAERVADILNKTSIQYQGFVVTDLRNNKKWLKEHKVFEIGELENTPDTGIVLALNESNKKEVIPLLQKNGFQHVFKL